MTERIQGEERAMAELNMWSEHCLITSFLLRTMLPRSGVLSSTAASCHEWIKES